METKANLYPYQNPFSKWLFAVVLLLSFFNFSGFSIAPVQIKTDTQQTGLLGNPQRKPIKSVSYKSALNQLRLVKYLNAFLTPTPHYLAVRHTLLYNLVFIEHSKPNLYAQNIPLLHKIISVSKNDDDDHLKC